MSVLIKSNKVSSNSLGTLKMLGTTAQAEFDKYKQRVLADGGVVVDEQKTFGAFEALFKSNMYGNINTVISGSYGVKLDLSGGLQKLYSLDGFDLIAVSKNNAPLPVLTASNAIDFSSNIDYLVDGGAYFVSEQKHLLSKIGRFGMGAKVVSVSRNVGEHIAAASMRGEIVETTAYNNLVVNLNKNLSDPRLDLLLHLDPLDYNAYNNFDNTEMGFVYNSNLIAFLSQPDLQNYLAVRDGLTIKTLLGTAYKEISTEATYLSFGAGHRSNNNNLFTGIIDKFICFNHGSESSIKTLTATL